VSSDPAKEDPDAWLDRVHDVYPSIVPSHYALVHGVEPYEKWVTGEDGALPSRLLKQGRV
jgi:hypothetical protein